MYFFLLSCCIKMRCKLSVSHHVRNHSTAAKLGILASTSPRYRMTLLSKNHKSATRTYCTIFHSPVPIHRQRTSFFFDKFSYKLSQTSFVALRSRTKRLSHRLFGTSLSICIHSALCDLNHRRIFVRFCTVDTCRSISQHVIAHTTTRANSTRLSISFQSFIYTVPCRSPICLHQRRASCNTSSPRECQIPPLTHSLMSHTIRISLSVYCPNSQLYCQFWLCVPVMSNHLLVFSPFLNRSLCHNHNPP